MENHWYKMNVWNNSHIRVRRIYSRWNFWMTFHHLNYISIVWSVPHLRRLDYVCKNRHPLPPNVNTHIHKQTRKHTLSTNTHQQTPAMILIQGNYRNDLDQENAVKYIAQIDVFKKASDNLWIYIYYVCKYFLYQQKSMLHWHWQTVSHYVGENLLWWHNRNDTTYL